MRQSNGGQLRFIVTILLAALPSVALGDNEIGQAKYDLVIQGGLVVDGSGNPGVNVSLGIKKGRICKVGAIAPRLAEQVIDADGLAIAPGFIDLHTHSDRTIVLDATRGNRNYQAQGVTTIVTGNCGFGPIDVSAYFDEIDSLGAGTNVIHLIPHGDLRESIIGRDDRPPTDSELEEMEALVAEGMEAGAWGISTGLIYIPSRYADTEELIALSEVVADYGGIYASHIRNEGTRLLQSIEEAIEIGAAAGVPTHISHLKSGGREAWGLIVPACERIAEARTRGLAVTADQYPYTASSTSIGAMIIPDWSRRGGSEEFAAIADSESQGKELREAIRANLRRRDGGASIRIARYEPRKEWVGLDLVTIGTQEARPVEEIAIEIERNGGAAAINFMMLEEDVRFGMQQPFVATASDGSAHLPGGDDRPHPRAYGTFPRKIRYALEDQVLSLEEAIRAATSLPASILGLPDRGVITEGAVADLVLFDPMTFRDAATFDNPIQYATGVEYLFLEGIPVIDQGEFTEALPGRALRLQEDGPADLIIQAGRIWTGVPGRPQAEAIAIRNGKIATVGSMTQVERFRGDKTKFIELPDGLITPGLIDAHVHLLSLGGSLESVDLRDVTSLDEVKRLVAEQGSKTPENAWITGRNWDQSLWPGRAFPTATILDEVVPDRPVWLRRVDGHAAWANSKAMELAGISRETTSPSDGQIIRDQHGEPTGVFIDGAMGLIDQAVPSLSQDDLRRLLLRAQDAAIEAGLTGVHDAGVPARIAKIFRELDREGALKLRVYGMANPPDGREVEFASKPPGTSAASERFQLTAIKLFMDGAMGSRGALMFSPYADDHANTGLFLIEPEVLEATTVEALKNGWQICTHAIGDRGNALVLDAYENALQVVPKATDARLRVEHAQVVRRTDVKRFARSRIIASMQPSHASTDKRWADLRLGPDRVPGAYAWRWFKDEGVALAFGSDVPVEIVDPTWGLFAAVTRQDGGGLPAGGWHPEHQLTLHEALTAFTAGSAFASFDEDRLGVIKPGMDADLTLFKDDLFRLPPIEWIETEIAATIIEGEIVYSSLD